MRLLRRPLPLAGWLLAFLSLWLLAGTVRAQTNPLSSTSSSGDLMQLLQGLSPDEQQAIENRLGTASGTMSQFGLSNLNEAQVQQYEQELEVRQRRQQEEEHPLIPLLKGGDWVIVQIGFQLPPAISTQAPQASQTLIQAAMAQGRTLTPEQLQALQSAAGTSSNAAAAPQAAVASTMTPAEKQRAQAMIQTIMDGNPYQLSRNGELTLPGFAPIVLLGLTQEAATLRLSVVPAFQSLEARLTLLPLEKTGEQALKPFGYDFFQLLPQSFAPLTNVPIPSNYVVGPGDVVDVLLYGNQNHEYQLVVGRDGQINFPQLGPIPVGGQLFSAVQTEIESRVQHQMIGVRASVTMAQSRSIQVLVAGDAFQPGSYTISALGTITSALYAAGGIRKTGSLRKIQLKRDGVVVDTLDLYDLLIHGSTIHDDKLMQGDVVFVSPVGPTVAIDGEVERPAIYELKSETTPAQAIALAGGLTPNADTAKATMIRIEPSGERTVLSLNLTAAQGAAEGLRNGDYIHVSRLRPTLDTTVLLQGSVYTPGPYEYHRGMRLTNILPSVGDLKPDSDLHYVLIRRELPPDRRVQALSANLAAAWANPGSDANLVLQPRDQITVFDLSSSRDRIIQPILSELKMQSTAEQPEPVVSVSGQVNVQGQYPLEPGMRVEDLVRAGGGLANGAYTGMAELTRYAVNSSGTRETRVTDIDLGQALRGNSDANLLLRPYDVLTVKEVSQWANQASITLRGEVRFPGTYTITPGETLKSVLERAGVLTQYAFPQGAVFTRVVLQQREQEQMDMLAARMKVELGVLALRATASTGGANVGNAESGLVVGRSLLQELQGEKAVGRLVINLPCIVRQPANSPCDVVLRDGDVLYVPKIEQEVSVIGEVQDPTSHLYNPSLSRDDYIGQSGGFTAQADSKRIYVVRADGSVIANEGSRWFNRGSNVQIEPGDTIVVPINATQMLPLPFWQAVTGIVFNVAIAVAAIHGL